MKKLLALIVAALFCASAGAVSTVRYSETLLAKESNSTRAVLLRGASVYVYEVGGTVSLTASATTTITLYDSSHFSTSDTIEISSSGLTATVTGVPTGTTITINTPLSVTAGDRVLNTTTAVTIYRDEGGTTTITQPATSDSAGRIVFFVDATSSNVFDLKAVSTDGKRFIDYDVPLGGGGGGGGGWTDTGSIVRLSTLTDSVGIGTATPTGALEIEQDVSGATNPTAFGGSPANPTSLLRLKADIGTDETYSWWADENGELYLRLIGNGNDIEAIRNGGFGERHFGDIENMDSSTFGQLNIRPGLNTRRGLVVSGATSQSANLLELRDSTEAVKASVSPAGNGLFVGTLSVTGAATFSSTLASGAQTVTGAVTASSTVQGSGLRATGSDLRLNGLTYVTPSSHGSGTRYLSNNGSGTLSWALALQAVCLMPVSFPITIPSSGSPDYWLPLGKDGDCDDEGGITPCEALAFSERWYAPAAGSMAYLRAVTSAAAGATQPSFTIYKNGVAQSLTCQITTGNTSCSDSSNTVTYVAGDYLALYAENLTSTLSAGVASVCMSVPQ